MTERIFETPFGSLLLMALGDSLIYCNWINDDCRRKEERIRRKYADMQLEGEECTLEESEKQLKEYFNGDRTIFDLKVKTEGTNFQEEVWKVLKLISYGTTVTYTDLSRMMKKPRACRAIANACGSNPIAIIQPCHRVVGKTGIGGYTGGLDKKVSLLNLEKSI